MQTIKAILRHFILYDKLENHGEDEYFMGG
jgi:hypothetical protein